MSFANPLGLLALVIGIPAVVIVHLLRVKARPVSTSTLFLLEVTRDSDEAGRRLDRLQSSPLFWLRILAVCVLAWVLAEPRWLRPDARQRVVLIVDASASMSAFRNELADALNRELPRIRSGASQTEWVVLASDVRRATLYSGSEMEPARDACIRVEPRLGTHDFGPVLLTALGLAGPSGRVVLATDRPLPVPSGVEILAVGAPVDNVGFAGAEIGEDGVWKAIVKNSGRTAQLRHLGDERVELGPGELAFLQGSLPAGADVVELDLEADRFALDDGLVLLRPRPKPLGIYVAPTLRQNRFIERFLETLEPFDRVESAAASDLAIADEPVGGAAALVFRSGNGGASYRKGRIVAERHPFVEGLDFRGLLVRGRPDVELSGDDRVLLWQGDVPLMVLRGELPELVLHFGLDGSNADRVPAFVLALHRFAAAVRSSKIASEQKNVETGQLLSVASDGPLEIDGVPLGGSAFRAPLEPGVFEVRSGDRTLLRAAARFADVREADLTEASSLGLDEAEHQEAIARSSQRDPFETLWVLALMGLLVAGWSRREA
ncbi:MAG TPA: BatA domain-containing protein [Vicinamibacteria bacterium]|nr:BatA domain-containing protein [Vicinamibacteria bacterium]